MTNSAKKHKKTSQGVAGNVTGSRWKRRRASQKTSQASQKTSQDVAGRRRTSQGVAGRRRASQGCRSSVSGKNCRFQKVLAQIWRNLLLRQFQTHLQGNDDNLSLKLAFSAKHGRKPWFQQCGLCVFANRVHVRAFAHPTCKPRGCLYPAHAPNSLKNQNIARTILIIGQSIGQLLKIFRDPQFVALKKMRGKIEGCTLKILEGQSSKY